jgi:glycine/D-amino acid oxidase-like deaminating enzyme
MPKSNYLGRELSWFWRKCKDDFGAPSLSAGKVSGFYETEEVAVDPAILAALLVNRLSSQNLITLSCGTEVKAARRSNDRFLLDISKGEETSSIEADFVINCAWDDRIRLDRLVEKSDNAIPYNYRVKYQITVRPKKAGGLLATTMVQGPYGDIVPRKSGDVYISWYPEGRTYFAPGPPPRRILEDRKAAQDVAEKSLTVMQNFFPALKGAEILSSWPGVIMASGVTDVDLDVDEIQSGLHSRHLIGVRANQGWISVDTGKLTMAPFFARQVAALISDMAA